MQSASNMSTLAGLPSVWLTRNCRWQGRGLPCQSVVARVTGSPAQGVGVDFSKECPWLLYLEEDI